MASLSLKNVRLIDPASAIDKITNIHIDSGRIAAIGRAPRNFEADDVIDLSGQIASPGFVELGAHLREPGFEYKATIATECRAAAAGGFTSVCCLPDTLPVIDNASVVEHIKQRASRTRAARVLCLGALTQGLEGEVLAEMRALKESGCAAVTNADRAIRDTAVLRHALAYAATCELTVMLHPLEYWLTRDGTMHEGAVSTRLGIPGVAEAQELIALQRDLTLVEETGVRAHFCRLSSAKSVALIKRARRNKLPVSADVDIAHLLFTERDVGAYDPNFHLRPPLREAKDRTRLRAAVRQGDIQAICSNHEPHDADAKATPFSLSAPGISTFDTFLPNLLALVDRGAFDLASAIAAVTEAPRTILGLNAGSLAVGSPADICVFDPNYEWTVSSDTIVSSGHNTPHLGETLTGKVTLTLVDGRIVHKLND